MNSDGCSLLYYCARGDFYGLRGLWKNGNPPAMTHDI